MGGRKKTAITLEKYEDFRQYPCSDHLTSVDLNNVIFMHGFRRIHNQPKCVLYEALRTIDLVKPERSTLGENLSPYDSFLSLDVVKKDLELLNWQECPVQSMETVIGNGAVFSGSSFGISRKRRRSKRTRKIFSAAAVAEGNGRSSAAPGGDSCVAADVEFGRLYGAVAGAGAGAGAGGDSGGTAATVLNDCSMFVDTYRWEEL